MRIFDCFKKHYYMRDGEIVCSHRKKLEKCTILYKYHRFFKNENYVAFIGNIREKKIALLIGQIIQGEEEIHIINDDYIKLCVIAEMYSKLEG